MKFICSISNQRTTVKIGNFLKEEILQLFFLFNTGTQFNQKLTYAILQTNERNAHRWWMLFFTATMIRDFFFQLSDHYSTSIRLPTIALQQTLPYAHDKWVKRSGQYVTNLRSVKHYQLPEIKYFDSICETENTFLFICATVKYIIPTVYSVSQLRSSSH